MNILHMYVMCYRYYDTNHQQTENIMQYNTTW